MKYRIGDLFLTVTDCLLCTIIDIDIIDIENSMIIISYYRRSQSRFHEAKIPVDDISYFIKELGWKHYPIIMATNEH